MDISLFSLLFYYVNSNSKRFGNSSIQNTKNSWKQSSVSSIAVVGSTKRQKKINSLTLSAFVVSCCAQQLLELIQQFRIIEKFRENEAVLTQLRSRKHKKDSLFLHLMFLVLLNNCLNWVNIFGTQLSKGLQGQLIFNMAQS